ncbi:FAD:protein FMN transferase [Reinekea blandensis]|uniref:FAD:protein FMN transferase n=1 Tax=Reinekea blandensis MED297 TaxID=314283 RepID=A4BHM4_9GAMM|nr:FAD:protein FMN transferase [Reinekea blandensis]EAR08422.1 thiamine biosynthesis lipoprotein [Reinekea blandensis MED297]
MIRNWLKPVIQCCIIAVLLSGCRFYEQTDVQTFSGYAMGTSYSIKLVSTLSEARGLQIGVEGVLSDINQRMSTYLPRSDLSRFAELPVGESLQVDEKTITVVQQALNVARETDGAFDPTIAPLVDLWGFGPTARQSALPSGDAIAAELENVGYQEVGIDASEQSLVKLADRTLDLSAIAKGYAVDQVAQYLEAKGYSDFLVEVGGEMRFSGQKPNGDAWRIAIEKPDPMERAPFRLLEMRGHAVATSGDYRNYIEVDGQRYSHTIDPETGYPIDHDLASVTVVMDSCMAADAYATAFNVMGRAQALQKAEALNIAVYIIYREADGFKTEQSSRFTALFGNAPAL